MRGSLDLDCYLDWGCLSFDFDSLVFDALFLIDLRFDNLYFSYDSTSFLDILVDLLLGFSLSSIFYLDLEPCPVFYLDLLGFELDYFLN